MLDPFYSKYLSPTKLYRKMSLLHAIHQSPESSQHCIAKMTHLSSSMVNNYMKSFVNDELIQILGESNRTRSYHLTEKGKNSLMNTLLFYSAEIVRLYGDVKQKIAIILNGFYHEGIRTIALFGVAETAEVVHAAIKKTQLVMIGVVDSDENKHGSFFNGLVIQPPIKLKEIKPDAVIITSFARQEEIYLEVKQFIGDDILIKKLSDLSESLNQ